MDLDNMIFSKGSTFIFGSWICETGDDGKLQGRLLEDSDHHQDFSISATTTDQLTGRFAQLVISDPTQISQLCASDSNSGSASEMESYPSSFGKPSSFWWGLRTRPWPIKNTTRSTRRIFSRSRILFRSNSTTWQHLIRHGPKDSSIRCLECH